MKTSVTQPYKGRWVVTVDDQPAGVVTGDTEIHFHAFDEAGRTLGTFADSDEALEAVLFVATPPPIHLIVLPPNFEEGAS